jgi:hypothetical protein
LEITAQEAKLWWDSLSPEKQEKYQFDINLIRNHHLHVLCGHNEKDHHYFERHHAFTFRKPWIKLDVHIDIIGDQGLGKTLVLVNWR